MLDGKLFNALTLGGTAVAILVAVATLIYQRRSAPPKRRLTVVQQQRATLLSAGSDAVRDITVMHNGEVVNDPFLTTVSIQNTGKQDISTAQFDDDRPLVLGFAAEIVDIIDISSVPAKFAVPRHKMDGSCIQIGPDLIKSGQEIVLQVLTEGAPTLECIGHLVDTKLAVFPEDAEGGRGARKRSLVSIGAVTGMVMSVVLGTVIAILASGSGVDTEASFPNISAEVTQTSSGIILIVRGTGFSPNSSVTIIPKCSISRKDTRTESISGSDGHLYVEIALPSVPPAERYMCYIDAILARVERSWESNVRVERASDLVQVGVWNVDPE